MLSWLKNPWILAPMAGVSEMPFRHLARRCGAGAAPTELISAKGLLYGQKRTQLYLRHTAEDAPFWVQLFGGEPKVLEVAAKMAVDLGADILDLNMGCPVRKVTRTGAGSALMTDPSRAHKVVEAMSKAGVPVSVKMRSGWDDSQMNAAEVIRAVADAGAMVVTVHARTRAQGYSGRADWQLLKHLVHESPIPIIGNGDAFTANDARRMLKETGCTAVMLGRGALGNPWVFSALTYGAPPPTPEERWALIEEHFDLHLNFVGDEERAVRRFRQHFSWYCSGLPGARGFRAQIFQTQGVKDVRRFARDYFLGVPAAASDVLNDTAHARAQGEVKGALG